MLKRDISTINILVASAGGMIGSGWLFSPYISAQMAGSNALISWIIAALFMLFIALPLCELGTMFSRFRRDVKLSNLYSWTGSRFFICLDFMAFIRRNDSH
nr:hypothetical protein [Legionella quateirensis]